MTIRTLRHKLANKKIIWVQSSSADADSRFMPETKDGINNTLVYIPKFGMLHVDNGSTVTTIQMSERQYKNLFGQYGYNAKAKV